MTASQGHSRAQWKPDVLPGYRALTLALGADPDGEGDLVAGQSVTIKQNAEFDVDDTGRS